MAGQENRVRVNVNIEIPGTILQTIVQNARDIVGRNPKGHYRIDTADLLEDLLSRFILEKDFEAYAANRKHYTFLDGK